MKISGVAEQTAPKVPIKAQSADDIHCTLEARLVGLDALVVKDHAANAHQAIEGAVRKLKRAVGTTLAKHDPRGHRNGSAAPAADLTAGDNTPV